jgi:hypothetical protein
VITSDQHFRYFAEFVSGVQLAGGTTPHVVMTVEAMSRLKDDREKLWFAGCYALVYNWPTAERIFLEWRPEEFSEVDFWIWLEDHWAGTPLRKERKAIYRKPFFVECAASYLRFTDHLLAMDTWPESYGEMSEMFLRECKYMGRYILIRWLEVMRRAFGTNWVMPDIHSDGGQHPRKALAMFYPDRKVPLLGGNTVPELMVSDQAANQCLLELDLNYGINTDYYTIQSLLCEYKQQVLGKKHYPGKSIDTEMDYFRRVYDHWGPEKAAESSFYDIRKTCFPEWSLGEVSGWNGARKELGSVLVDYGYTWSDALYDYPATIDLGSPVLRANGEASLL